MLCRRNMLGCRIAAATARASWSARASAHAAAFHQERIGSDGSLVLSSRAASPYPDASSSAPQAPPQQQPRPPGLPAAAPVAPPVRQEDLEALVDMLQGSRRVVVLTGAGVSTESNVPDYRGPNGAYTTGFRPMTHQQFMARPENRARYWARSFVGWHEFAHVQHNAAHEGLARLQRAGWVQHLITQNVDRLHQKAGSPPHRVLEIHGTTHRVVCTQCGEDTCRHHMQQRLAQLNPEAAALAERVAETGNMRAAWARALRAGTAADARKTAGGEDAEQVPVRRPDGDVELQDAGQGFHVPPCDSCGGALKPAVVFFGDSVPRDRVDSALQLSEQSDLMLVVGSSLFVWSAFRLVKAAKAAGSRLAIVNVGETRADGLADLLVEALAGEVLTRLATHPSLLLPRA